MMTKLISVGDRIDCIYNVRSVQCSYKVLPGDDLQELFAAPERRLVEVLALCDTSYTFLYKVVDQNIYGVARGMYSFEVDGPIDIVSLVCAAVTPMNYDEYKGTVHFFTRESIIAWLGFNPATLEPLPADHGRFGMKCKRFPYVHHLTSII
jgi:hypothetical protein